MGIISENQLRTHLKAEQPSQLYYLYGTDTGTVQKIAKAVKTKILGRDYSSADYNQYEGKAFSVSEFADASVMFSMCCQYNFIVINDLNADDLGADDLKMLLKTLESLPADTIVLIYITGFDIKNGKKTPGAKNKKIIDCAAKKGIVFEAAPKKPAELSKYIAERIKNNGCTVTKENAQLIAQRCLSDTLMAENSADMLCSYVPSGEITAEMIMSMIPAAIDTNAFALASAVTNRNTSAALNILDELISERTESVIIISALSNAFIDLYRARAAIESSVSDSDMAADFNYRGREFVVRNAFSDARKTSLKRLHKCLLILRSADLECKSTRLNQKTIIEKAIITMISLKN